MTTLGDSLGDYLAVRRRLGFEMPQDGRLLEGFVEFLEQAGAPRITTELALAWARLPGDAHPHRWRQRLSVARGFARHYATLDPTSEVPSKDLLPGHRPRIVPYIYTEEEIAALMAAARQLRPRLRGVRHATLIGLLAVTGMRPGEAVGLDRHDIDLHNGVVAVRAGKQKKQREVPLHATTISALRDYARLRDACMPDPSTPAFFVSARGRRMGREELNRTFTKMVCEVGFDNGRGARVRPRPHDLRHAFAVNTLLGWYRAGEDIDRRMPLLSTWLGHVDPASTYWYLEAVPELLELVSLRLEELPELVS
ncbi:MAG: tyrosine-type recombinase/integrase [Actinobacteria bacterium]|nr:tyrosine-type recombinase/integrase [Actinomycetota bacterium]MCA1681600.1 tyrosine-type recombinase/integrase [Actinomycetota bacterium]